MFEEPGDDTHEAKLRTRFLVARQFVVGGLDHYFVADAACKELQISRKTLARDIARARMHQTFEEWRPKRRGPPLGQRRLPPRALERIELKVYANAHKKLNITKLARELVLELGTEGIAASQSTVERAIRDIIAADPAHFANASRGREGQHDFALQIGSLETDRPLQIVCIDHTVLDQRTWLMTSVGEVVCRPCVTAAIDLYTECVLAAFLAPWAPSRLTVALAMAMMATPKSDLLQLYDIPGEREACGLPEVLYVDGAAELKSKAVQRGCSINGIKLWVGLPGRPERRAKVERWWRTLNQEVHTWEGTTLSNPQELQAYGGQKPPALDFETVQRKLLAAVGTYNNETYGSDRIPPVMRWRDLAGSARMSRMIPRDPRRTFLDFLPGNEAKINFEGIKAFGCQYRGPELAALRYRGVGRKDKVPYVFDPRDVSRIWLFFEGRYIEVPRAYPKRAPRDLYALLQWRKRRYAEANEKRDTALLAKLSAIQNEPRHSFFNFDDPTPIKYWSTPNEISEEEMREDMRRFLVKAGDLPPSALLPEDQPPLAFMDDGFEEKKPRQTSLPPDFTIPDFNSKVK